MLSLWAPAKVTDHNEASCYLLGPQTSVVCPIDIAPHASTRGLLPNVSLEMYGQNKLRSIACEECMAGKRGGRGWLLGNELTMGNSYVG